MPQGKPLAVPDDGLTTRQRRRATGEGSTAHVAALPNRAGTAGHEEILRAALADTGVPALGVLWRDEAIAVPSRHLGLVPAAERQPAASDAVRRLSVIVGQAVDLDAVMALAASAAPRASSSPASTPPTCTCTCTGQAGPASRPASWTPPLGCPGPRGRRHERHDGRPRRERHE
jgi:cobyrinic acid a,c-diamide synthase